MGSKATARVWIALALSGAMQTPITLHVKILSTLQDSLTILGHMRLVLPQQFFQPSTQCLSMLDMFTSQCMLDTFINLSMLATSISLFTKFTLLVTIFTLLNHLVLSFQRLLLSSPQNRKYLVSV